MFERFTDRARRVVVVAQAQAAALNHNYIGTEHLLLGLVHDGDGVAAKALQSLSISLEAVRSQVEEIVGVGNSSPSGHIPFTPRAKKVLEMSLRESLQLGHNYIGTEHILLGLVREGDGVAAKVLGGLGAELGRVRDEVINLLSGYSGPTEPVSVDELAVAAVDESFRSVGARRSFSAESRQVLERALVACLAEGDREVEPRHIIGGLLAADGLLARRLVELGADPDALADRLRTDDE